jgi:hypothetical protein
VSKPSIHSCLDIESNFLKKLLFCNTNTLCIIQTTHRHCCLLSPFVFSWRRVLYRCLSVVEGCSFIYSSSY